MKFEDFANENIVIADGAMGTMLGGQMSDLGIDACDIMSILRPSEVLNVHNSYLNAGARLITTNTFNANELLLGNQDYVSINRVGATLAREAVDDYFAQTGVQCWVAGSLGPIAPGSGSWDEIVDAYQQQIDGLVRNGADVILLETVCYLSVCRTAVVALRQRLRLTDFPLIILVAVDNEGCLCGDGLPIVDFFEALSDVGVLAYGVNCGQNTEAAISAVGMLRCAAGDRKLMICPSAGIGVNVISSADFVTQLEPLVASGSVGIVGGCCGTTPAHIVALAEMTGRYALLRTKCHQKSIKSYNFVFS